MGFHQTATHRQGKGSYHQVGLVRGQFGDIPEDQWLDFISQTGFDGWEEASWELDLSHCDTDAGADAYARERVAKAKSRGLEVFSVAAHLQGQALGDEPSEQRHFNSSAERLSRHTPLGEREEASSLEPIPISFRKKSGS